MASLPFFKTVKAAGIRGYFSLRSAQTRRYLLYDEKVKKAFSTLNLEQKISFLEQTDYSNEFHYSNELHYLADQQTLVGIIDSSGQRNLQLYACDTLKLISGIYRLPTQSPILPPITSALSISPQSSLDKNKSCAPVQFGWMTGQEPPSLDLIQKLQSILPAQALQFYVNEYLLPVLEKAMMQPDGYSVVSQQKQATGNQRQEVISHGTGHWVDYGNYHGRNAGLVWEDDAEYKTQEEYEIEEVRTTKSHKEYRLKAFNLLVELKKLYEPNIKIEELRQAFAKKDALMFPHNQKEWTEKYLSWE